MVFDEVLERFGVELPLNERDLNVHVIADAHIEIVPAAENCDLFPTNG